jgi:hypothetical protein
MGIPYKLEIFAIGAGHLAFPGQLAFPTKGKGSFSETLSPTITAFANGLWMSCNGFMVTPPRLNPFYRYVFYYIDYQAYVFKGLVVNEFGSRVYACGESCHCMFETRLKDQCLIDGVGVLENYGFHTGGVGQSVGIVIAIVSVLRLMGWAAMQWRK